MMMLKGASDEEQMNFGGTGTMMAAMYQMSSSAATVSSATTATAPTLSVGVGTGTGIVVT